MVDSAIVGRDIVIVKEETLLYCTLVSQKLLCEAKGGLHLLKLVTGVDISTRAVNKSGRPGKEVKRRSRTAAAEANRVAFLRSTFIVLCAIRKMKQNCMNPSSITKSFGAC